MSTNIKRRILSNLDPYYFLNDISSTPLLISSQKRIRDRDPLEQAILNIAAENKDIQPLTNIPPTYYVEFCIESKSKLHIEYDETIKTRDKTLVYPLSTSYTFLHDDFNTFVVITDVDVERYKYKNFAQVSEYAMIFPKRRTHVLFDPSKYFGLVSGDDHQTIPRILKISIWRDRPEHIEEYMSHMSDKSKPEMIELMEETTLSRYIYVENMFTRDFMESVLYKKDNGPLQRFFDLLEPVESGYIPKSQYEPTYNVQFSMDYLSKQSFIVKSEPFPYLQSGIYYPLINTYGDVIKDLVNFSYEEKLEDKNRFKPTHIKKQVYSTCVCKWIVHEVDDWANKHGGWNKLNSVYADRVKHVHNYLMISCEMIKEQVAELYNLNGLPLVVEHVVFQRYDPSNNHTETIQLFQENQKCIHVQILLTDCSDPIVDSHVLSRGDMLISTGKSGCVVHEVPRYMVAIILKIDLSKR